MSQPEMLLTYFVVILLAATFFLCWVADQQSIEIKKLRTALNEIRRKASEAYGAHDATRRLGDMAKKVLLETL